MEKMECMIRNGVIALLSLGIIGALTPFSAVARKVAATGQQAKGQSAATVQNTVSFSGSAGVVNFTEAGVNLATIGQTDALLSGGGELSVDVGATNILGNVLHIPALSLQSAQALTTGANNQTHSEAVINNFSTTVVATNGTLHTISFDSLSVEANATATGRGVATTGRTTINGLVIDNIAVNVTGAANQTIAIDGGTIVINAQTKSGSGNRGEITVSGLLVSLQGCLSGPIGFARAGISFSGTAPQPPSNRTDFAGGATVITITNKCEGRLLTIGATGPVLRRGSIVEVTVGPTNVSGPAGQLDLLFGEGLTAATANQTHSEVTLDNLSLTLIGTNGISHTFTLDFLKTTADATATSSGIVTAGATVINGLVIDNVPITVTGEINQMVALSGGGTVAINVQNSNTSRNSGAISVAGLMISLDNCLMVTIGLAQAGVSFTGAPPGPPPSSACDKLTGGGFIILDGGAKGTFAVSGGIRRGQFWGHLNYIDHSTGMHVRSTEVTGYAVVDATTRRIDYNVDVDGSAGTCTVLAADNGEPGRDDMFDITVSNGYHAGGDLGGSGSGGGNIQLHKCPPGWAK